MKNSERHMTAKLLGSSLQLLELERQKIALQETFTRTIRDRIIFDLPLKGGVGLRRRPHPRATFWDRGTIGVELDREEVHEVPMEYYDRFEYYLSRAKNFEEFDATYRELVSDCFTGKLLSRKVPRSYYDQR